MIFLALILIFLSILIPLTFERKVLSPVSVLWCSFFIPILLFGINLSLLFYTYVLMSFIVYIFSYYFFLNKLKVFTVKSNSNEILLYNEDYKVIIFLSVIFCILIYVYNVSGVFFKYGINAYSTISSKDIELTFGRSTIFNYLFFLNMVMTCTIYYFIKSQLLSKRWYFIIAIMFLFLSMTGIKSTLLFGLVIFLFFYFISSNNVSATKLIVISISMMILVYLMFLFVNIGFATDEGLEIERFSSLLYGYIGVNYENLDLELNTRNDFMFGKYTFIFITKLIDPSMQGGYFASNELILIDPNFNMGTFLREYFVDYGFFGSQFVVVLIAFFGALFNMMAQSGKPQHQYVMSVYYTACAFSFFGNQFIRLQFIVIALQSLLLFYFIFNFKIRTDK